MHNCDVSGKKEGIRWAEVFEIATSNGPKNEERQIAAHDSIWEQERDSNCRLVCSAVGLPGPTYSNKNEF